MSSGCPQHLSVQSTVPLQLDEDCSAGPGGVVPARRDRLNVSAGHANSWEPAVLEIGRGTRRETPALGTCRAGAPLGAKRLGKDSPPGESGQRQHQQGSQEGVPGAR
ncbi:hypothetical protein NDU88_004766 [Pleurodeles waltl]|uniref:Uncharacterized protein n=1 Tax=Pleurodeles waltl TaxID=8319 RepID=A0AAV7VJ57_PLEWA|nr:hypothetical protein NDU88_004766 [Pleurodeles waltl]